MDFQSRAINFNLGIGTTGPGAELDVAGTVRASKFEGGCKDGYVRLSGGNEGTCIQVDPRAEAGCWGDECIHSGMRQCTCAEIKVALFNGLINPTTDGINTAGEYCLSGIGHCMGNGPSCTGGATIEISKIWPNFEHQATPTHWYDIDSEGGVAICDQARPVAHAGYPYGSYRCCYDQ